MVTEPQIKTEADLGFVAVPVLPGCVWDWSHPTLWLLRTEIPRADWCLVARRLGHLGRRRRC